MDYSINNYNLKEIANSNNYLVYSFVLNNKKYVLKTVNKKAGSINQLRKTYKLLSYLNKKNLKTLEKVCFIDKKNNYLISEFIEGKELGLNDLVADNLKLFIKELVKINRLKVDKKLLKVISPFKFKQGALRRANIIKKNSKLEKIASLVISYLKDLNIKKDYNNKAVYLDHGDLAGANIFLTKDNNFKFIDWDNARLTTDASFILANTFYYASCFDKNKQEQIISLYLQEFKYQLNEKEFKTSLNQNFKLIAISAIIWALRACLKAKDKKEYKHFLNMAKNRLNFLRQIF